MQSLVKVTLFLLMASEVVLGARYLSGPDGGGSHVQFFYNSDGALDDADFFSARTFWPSGFVCEIDTTVNNNTSTMTMGNASKEYRNCYHAQNYCLLCADGGISNEEDFYKCGKAIPGAVLMSPDTQLKMNRTRETCLDLEVTTRGLLIAENVGIDIRRYLHEWVVDDWHMNGTSVKEWATWGNPKVIKRNNPIHVVLTINDTNHNMPVLTKMYGETTAYGAICEVNFVNATILASYDGADNTTEDDWVCLEASGKKHCYYHRNTQKYIRYQRKYCEANGGYLFSPSTTAEAKAVINHFEAQPGFDTMLPVYIGISQICGSYQIANGAIPWNNSVWPYWDNDIGRKFVDTMNLPDCNRIYDHRCKYTPSKCPLDWKYSTVDTFDTNNDITPDRLQTIVPNNRPITEKLNQPETPPMSDAKGMSTEALIGASMAGCLLLALVVAVLVLIYRNRNVPECVSVKFQPGPADEPDLNTDERLGLVSADSK